MLRLFAAIHIIIAIAMTVPATTPAVMPAFACVRFIAWGGDF